MLSPIWTDWWLKISLGLGQWRNSGNRSRSCEIWLAGCSPKKKWGHLELISVSQNSALLLHALRFLLKLICSLGPYKIQSYWGALNISAKVLFTPILNKTADLPQRWPRDAPYIWVPGKFSRVPEYAQGYFSRNFNGVLFRMSLWMCVQNLKFLDLPFLR